MAMKSSLRQAGRNILPDKVLSPRSPVWLALTLWLGLVVLPARAEDVTNSLEIQAIRVNDKSLPFRGRESVNLGAFPENVVFGFWANTNVRKQPLRVRYTLEGYENVWHEASSEMDFTVRFFNNSGDQISNKIYSVNGESSGWNGLLKSSPLRHRRETLVVPPGAARLLIVISS